MPEPRPADCRVGDQALSRGSWEEARAAFAQALAVRESPEALEGLGLAGWWLDLADVVFDARERAYRLYGDRGDRAAAARVAVWLAWDTWAFRGEHAVASGWLQRARTAARGRRRRPRARVARAARRRARAARRWRSGSRAPACDRRHPGRRARRGTIDLEMLGRSLQGLALVASGAVAEGMRALDEVNAAVVAGELTDLVAIGLSCCYMIAACERVRDYDRAVQWCTRLKAFCAKWGLRPLFAVCRTQYASICMWRGTWLEAEQELTSRDRRARGQPSGDDGGRPGAPRGAAPPAGPSRRGGLAVRAVRAARPRGARARRARLRSRRRARRRRNWRSATCAGCPPHNRTDRAAGLDLLVRARVGVGDLDGARTALAELTAIAALVAHRAAPRRGEPRRRLRRPGGGTAPTRRAGISRTRSISSARAARRSSSRAPASSWRARWPPSVAPRRRSRKSQRAIAILSRAQGGAGAVAGAGAARHAARPRRRRRPRSRPRAAGLTARELEVLRLVAAGPQQPDDRRTAVRQRAHRASPRRQHLQQAERVVARRRRRAGGAPRPPGLNGPFRARPPK